MKKREFFGKRHAGFFTEAQESCEEIRPAECTFLGFRGVDTGQRADGIEAVEEKVGIYLRLEGSQFGIARENAGFERAHFGLPRFFDSENYVVRGDGEQIEQEADAE